MQDLIFGSRAILACLEAGAPLAKIWLQAGKANPIYKEVITLAQQHAIPLSRVPLVKLQRLTRKNHQGAIAWRAPAAFVPLAHLVQHSFEAGNTPLLVVLDGVTDVGNVGALARTALAVGATGLVITTQKAAPITGQALKASAGALAYLPVARVVHLKEALTYMQASGLQVVACTEKATNTLYQTDLRVPTALVLGSEEGGIHPAHLRMADQHVAIPMQGPIGSLNVSVAGAVILYEAVRQRLS